MDEVVEQLLAIAAKDEKFEAFARQYEKFQALVATPAWVALEEHIRKSIQGANAQAALRLLEDDTPVDQRAVDYRRGYLRGMQAVVDFPGKIANDFDRQVEQAWRRANKVAELSDESEQEA